MPAVADSKLFDDIKRLNKLKGTDPGVFILAAHSFIEGSVKRYIGREYYNDGENVSDLLDEFCRDHIKGLDFKTYSENINCLINNNPVRKKANKVRHRFQEYMPSEMDAVTDWLASFFTLLQIEEHESVSTLLDYVDRWHNNKITPAESEDFKRLELEFFQIVKEKEALQNDVAYLQNFKQKAEAAEKELSVLEAKYKKASEGESKNELRRQILELTAERNMMQLEYEPKQKAEEYLHLLQRFSFYTRRRKDFTSRFLKLSTEQEGVKARISKDGSIKKNYLVKGSAGTGKTLVLLKVLEDLIKELKKNHDLDYELSSGILFLTYTRTLVKYDSYLAEMISPDVAGNTCIDTINHYLNSLSNEGSSIDLYCHKKSKLLKNNSLTIDAKELWAELDDIIYGLNLTKDEYMDMKPDGEAVWQFSRNMINEGIESGIMSQNMFCHYMLDQLSRNVDAAEKLTAHYMFIDEVQDLSPVCLLLLRSLCSGYIIMAGDSDQSLYNSHFRFKRLGINIQGNTSILKTNFRNSEQIHTIAEKYRQPGTLNAEYKGTLAIRPGPPVECFQNADINKLKDVLADRIKLFITALDYTSEDIAVLVADKKAISSVSDFLNKKGIQTQDIKDDGFCFKESKGVRVSTIHSAKGLDFPVVFLFIPTFFVAEKVDKDEESILARNLIYVGLTRGLEHVNIFTRTREKMYKCPAVLELLDVLEAE